MEILLTTGKDNFIKLKSIVISMFRFSGLEGFSLTRGYFIYGPVYMLCNFDSLFEVGSIYHPLFS